MKMRFCSLASGSSGNCYLVATQHSAILLDAGISAKRVCEGLAQAGLRPEDMDALLFTHEHSDHTKGLLPILRKCRNMQAYASDGTLRGLRGEGLAERFRAIRPGASFRVGEIEVRSFPLSHDAAEPTGYSFRAEGRQITVLTDNGAVSPEQLEELRSADLLVLEANHDVDMLRIGPYPYPLKRRILSDRGHLSNEGAAEALVQSLLEGTRPKRVLLAHLSKENNFPEMAFQTVKNRLEEAGLFLGRDLEMEILSRDCPGSVYEL